MSCGGRRSGAPPSWWSGAIVATCGGAAVPALAGGHDGLDGRGDTIVHLDRDHVRSRGLDRLVELDLAAVELQSASLADGIDDLLRGDRAEQPAVVACGVGDREHRLGEQRGVLLGLLSEVAHRLLGGFLATLRLGNRAAGRRLGELARDEEVPQVAGRDVDDVALLTKGVDVLSQDCLRHGLLGDVREQAELAGALDGAGELALMAAAAAGHASGADLALLGELAANATEVLVVDDVDLVPAIRAGLAPACAGGSLSIAPASSPTAGARGLLPTARLTCHLLLSPHRFQRKSPRSRDSEECIGRKADRLPGTGIRPHARCTQSGWVLSRLSITGRGITARVFP